MGEHKKSQRVLSGTVVSNKMEKTIVVEVKRRHSHPVYKRVITTSKKYKAHDSDNQCKIGDYVKIVEARPLSREKRWRLLEILSIGDENTDTDSGSDMDNITE